ncbi:MAG: F0F1 ATP synthase subunit delta [Prevotellaceae bacterium]|jgi:F-type H+-transporting ATPase subunit delta|nr:F0F1 ATP synthase subunit delta [Prevotellaceae bacterium]
MDIGIIASRYAKALMAYAKDTDTEERLYDEVRMLESSFRRRSDLREALANPILGVREKFALISIATVGNGELSREFGRFVALVLKNRREQYLPYICLSFIDLYRRVHHIATVKMITAVPTQRAVWERIRKRARKLLHASIELHTEVNPAIEGGFIIDLNDYRLDASIATQLKRVKKQFIEKNKRIV